LTKARLLYLDVCALSRPFDDQRFLRIRLETEAVNLIMSKVRDEQFQLAVSEAHFVEIRAVPDMIERLKLLSILNQFGMFLKVNKPVVRKRAEYLIASGFGPADAVHVSFAEYAEAMFVTCDDRLLKKCSQTEVRVWVGDPLSFCSKECLL